MAKRNSAPVGKDPSAPSHIRGKIGRASKTPVTTGPTIEQRIEDQRNELFGAMAMVAVARDSVDRDDNYDLWRVLDDAYTLFYIATGELNNISADAKSMDAGVRNA